MRQDVKSTRKLEPVLTETVSTDKNIAQLPEEFVKWLRKELEREGLPVTAITILGGKPYLNNLGVNWKLQEKFEIIDRIEYEWIQRPEKSNDYFGGARCRIYLKEDPEIVQLRASVTQTALMQGKSPKEIEEILRVANLIQPFVEDEGWLSAQDSAISWEYQYDSRVSKKVPVRLKLGNLYMHILTKAFDRAARKLIKSAFGLLEESGEDVLQTTDTKPAEIEIFTSQEVKDEKKA